MTAGTGASRAARSAEAAAEAAGLAMGTAGGRAADLVILFATPHHAGALEEVQRELERRCGTDRVVGCSASGVLSEAGEIEAGPGLVVMALGGLGDTMTPWLFPAEPTEAETLDGAARARIGGAPAAVLLAGLGATLGAVARSIDAVGSAAVVGAAASGPPLMPQTLEWCGGEVVRDGLAGISVTEDRPCRVGVAQGCQPLGEPLLITRGQGNVIREIAFRPAVEVLKEVLEQLPEEERARLRGGVFVGLALDEHKSNLGRGDFLVRNIVGMDPKSGALAVAETVQVGQSVQFQLRDRRAAHDDLGAMLARLAAERPGAPPRFGLYFNCLGRGSRLFEEPDHDVAMIRDRLGSFPLVGFFGNAELAPLAGRNRVHNYTGVLALFD